MFPAGNVWGSPPGVAGRAIPLVRRAPDDGEHAVIVLAGGAAQVGEEALWAETGVGQGKRDVLLAGRLARLDPAGADFDIVAEHPVVGLGIAGLAGVEGDGDGGLE